MTQQFWEQRWKNSQTGWDLGAASPPLTQYCAQIPPEKRHLAILIPGCGNGHEALFLLENGFSNITMLDIAPTAVEFLTRRLDTAAPGWQSHLKVLCGDFFEHGNTYDLILEQTFFCALDPAFREAYARQMWRLLRPCGKLAGVLFDRECEGGPPFGGSPAAYEALFSPYFHIHTLAPCYNSIPPRAGSEVFFVLEKTGV